MLLRLQNTFASMDQMVRNQERTANNLANADTAGFKRDRVFVEALDERLDIEGAPRSERIQTQWADLSRGTLDKTDNPLDVALNGEGFFVVEDAPTGEQRYTRDGRFVTDQDGQLRTASGAIVQGDDGPLVIPQDAGRISITEEGRIFAGDDPVGQLQVVTFPDPMDLERREGATFATDQPTEPVAIPSVQQGFVEGSNVNALHEMTEMIAHFRLFESQQKAMQTTDQILGQLVRDAGRF